MKLISIGNEDDDDGVKGHVIDTFGQGFWDRLSAALGGQGLRVPLLESSLHHGHALVEALGYDDAAAFVEQFSGERIYISKQPRLSDKRYVEAFKSGKTNRQIATELGVTDRQVRRILGRNGISNHRHERRSIGRPRLDQSEIDRRDRIVRLYLNGSFASRSDAADRLGVKPTVFSTYVQDYRRKTAIAAATASPAVSNAGLTGLAPVSGSMLHTTPENRASGL
ncbi:hypothetical protein [Agrobacterium fabrum]|uniref:hypothetical protein n=1 Tax=Agrobacterium fabrum TaxID=1176649 RepID=UPI003B9FA54A